MNTNHFQTLEQGLTHIQYKCLKGRVCGKDYSRSPEKTSRLHLDLRSTVISVMKQRYPAFEGEFEVVVEAIAENGKNRKIPVVNVHGETSAIDMVIRKKNTAETLAVIEVRAPVSSVSKNNRNYEMSAIGKAMNMLAPGSNLLFCPLHCPPLISYNRTGKAGEISWVKTQATSLGERCAYGEKRLDRLPIIDDVRKRIIPVDIPYAFSMEKNLIDNIKALQATIADEKTLMKHLRRAIDEQRSAVRVVPEALSSLMGFVDEFMQRHM